MASSSKTVIYAALGGNLMIAAVKFAAAGYTGSSAMFSEAVHSVVDTGNQLLILLGLRQASKPASPEHPFGHGLLLYFWTFVVAVLIFGLGAGVSFLEGFQKIFSPHPVENVLINYIVLAVCMMFEGAVWVIALRAFLREKGRLPWLKAVRASKDPTVFTVLFEDTAALLGLLVAFIGIGLGEALDMPVLDGAASIVIGVILATTATLLAMESRSLLIGEAVAPEVRDGYRRIVATEPGVVRINEVLTMHFGPRDVLVAISMDFEDARSAGAVEAAVTQIERRIKAAFPETKRVFIEAQSFDAHRRTALQAAALESAQQESR